ncbi:hypothetical protein [Microbacterium rhizophilus]|uniref:hypothetical protein n=1 Tax=Microbacterium rhizophilus TaxID=3138934 RepID=UPI0031E8C77A
MSTPAHPSARTPWGRGVALGLVLAVVVSIIVLAFSWPAVTSEPRDLPVAITGPAEQLAMVEQAVTENAEGAVALTEVDDRDAAVDAIEGREVYGAVVLGQAPEVLTSSAASPVAAQLLGGIAAQLQQQAAQAAAAAGAPAPTVAVTDVVPLLDTDPRGAGMTAASFPLVLGGMIGGIAITMAIGGVWRRVAALLAYSVAAGLAIAGILQGWFAVLAGAYLLNAAAFGLSLLAIGATIVGFASIVGRPGIALGPVLFLLIANPISGAAMPREFLPAPWGEVGQWFPPGAGATLVRDLSYFPGADTTFPWLVLAVWAAGGLVLAAIGHFRSSGPLVIAESDETQPAAA